MRPGFEKPLRADTITRLKSGRKSSGFPSSVNPALPRHREFTSPNGRAVTLGGRAYLVREGMMMRVDRIFSPEASVFWKYTFTFRSVTRDQLKDSSTTTRVEPLA